MHLGFGGLSAQQETSFLINSYITAMRLPSYGTDLMRKEEQGTITFPLTGQHYP